MSARLMAVLLLGCAGGVDAACSSADPRSWCIDQDDPQITGGAEAGDRFGFGIATGDFDGDGFPDLAIGSPGENDARGFVHWIPFDPALGRLSAADSRSVSPELLSSGATPVAGTEYGRALGALRRSRSEPDLLVISAPFRNVTPANPADCGGDGVCTSGGRVHLVRFASGLEPLVDIDFGRSEIAADDLDGGLALAVRDLAQPQLVIGAPGATVSASADAGRFTVVSQFQVALPVAETRAAGNGSQAGERFGSELAWSPGLEALGLALVAGSARRSVGSAVEAGAVRVVRGLDPLLPQGFVDFDASAFPASSPTPGGHFGTAVALGDFDGDGFEDLAIGAPGDDVGGFNAAGRVYVLFGTSTGLDAGDPTARRQVFDAGLFVGADAGANDGFGSALVAGDLDADGFDDLLVSSPGHDADEGAIYRLRGEPAGLDTPIGDIEDQRLLETSVGGTRQVGARFGAVLALRDFDRDGFPELIVGAPFRDVAGRDRAGRVYVSKALQPTLFDDGFEGGQP